MQVFTANHPFANAAAVTVSALRGFTLIEMVVTLALLGVMAMLTAPLAELTVQRSKEKELRTSLREIRSAIDRYKQAADQGFIERKVGDSGYPPDLKILVTGVNNQTDPEAARLYFLRRVPRDPFSIDKTLSAAATWGLRSYASPPDEPEEGDDVFDVYSRSSMVGLNGVTHSQW